MKSQTHDTTIKAWTEFSGAEHREKQKKPWTMRLIRLCRSSAGIKEINNSAWAAEPFAGFGFP